MTTDYCKTVAYKEAPNKVRVEDTYGHWVHDLTREQAVEVKSMVDRAFQKGFDQCGRQIRELLGP